MRESERISMEFYGALGEEGLTARTRPEWDAAIIHAVELLLRPGDRILDVGCGYGRITIPLAEKVYFIRAVDIAPQLIDGAIRVARDKGLDVQFDRASMCELPGAENSYDVILCLWSAFHELLCRDEQTLALQSMMRVLKPHGWALIEGPPYLPATEKEIASGVRYGSNNRIAIDLVNGLPRPGYRHDASSFSSLMEDVRVRHFRCYVEPWAGRDRQFLRFWKE